MNKSAPALLLYFAASLMYVFSIAFKWDLAVLLFKPMIFPAIYFYYYQESSLKPYLLPSLALWFFYIADMIILVEHDDIVVPIILFNLSAYLILIYLIGKDLLRIRRPEISNSMILIICSATIVFLCILYFALSLVFNASDVNFGLLTVDGIILTLLSVEIVAYYVLKNDTTAFFLLTVIICFIISDLFHVLFNYYDQFHVFIIINVFCQVVSFYFLVKYFLHKSHYNSVLNQYEK